MKQYLYITLVAILFLSSGLSAAAQTSPNPCNPSTGSGNLGYCPLEPIAGFTLGTTNADVPTFLQGLFRILFSLSALLAVGRLVLGGIMYMTSDVAGSKSQAKSWAVSALYGLLILAGSYLILYTINPDLVRLDLTISPAKHVTPAIPPSNTTGTPPANTAIFKDNCVGLNPGADGLSYHPAITGSFETLKTCTLECFHHGGKIDQTYSGNDMVGEVNLYTCVGTK